MSNPAADSEQRRRFSRVLFNAAARLKVDERDWPCEIHDLSLKGALIGISFPPGGIPAGAPCTLELNLGDTDARIRMAGTISHVEGANVGLRCESIDLDSVSHLRRLVELNLGDDTILQRELSALIARP